MLASFQPVSPSVTLISQVLGSLIFQKFITYLTVQSVTNDSQRSPTKLESPRSPASVTTQQQIHDDVTSTDGELSNALIH